MLNKHFKMTSTCKTTLSWVDKHASKKINTIDYKI